MTSTITPGAWRIYRDDKGILAVVDALDNYRTICDYVRPEAAALIVAAPALLAACKTALLYLERRDCREFGDHYAIDGLRAAIAAAEEWQ